MTNIKHLAWASLTGYQLSEEGRRYVYSNVWRAAIFHMCRKRMVEWARATLIFRPCGTNDKTEGGHHND